MVYQWVSAFSEVCLSCTCNVDIGHGASDEPFAGRGSFFISKIYIFFFQSRALVSTVVSTISFGSSLRQKQYD